MKENVQTKLNDFESRYDFSATEWQGLAARLDKRDLWRRGVFALLGGLLLLGLVGSNVALWRQNQALSQRISAVDVAKLIDEKTVNSTVLGRTDTVIKRTIIYQYDTIYRKTTLVQTQLLTSEGSKITTFQTPFSTTKITDKAVQTPPNSPTTLTTVPTTILDNNHTANAFDKSTISTNTPPQYLSEKMLKNEANSLIDKEKQTILATDTASNTKENIAKKPALAAVDTAASTPVMTAKKPKIRTRLS